MLSQGFKIRPMVTMIEDRDLLRSAAENQERIGAMNYHNDKAEG